MNVYKRLLRILRHRGEDMILFEMLMRGLNVVIGALVAIVINAVIEVKTGFVAINGVFLSWIDGTYLVVLSLCVGALLFIAIIEIVGLIHISHSYERGERPSIFTTFKFGCMKALGLFHTYGLSAFFLIFFVFTLFPLLQIGPSVFRGFSIPTFITDELGKSNSAYIIYILSVIASIYILYRSIFIFHIYSTRSITLFGSLKASWMITLRRSSFRHLFAFSILLPILLSVSLIVATAFVTLATYALSNGIILLFAYFLPENLYIIFYSSWVFMSTALLSVAIGPFLISVLCAYLEIRNPDVLGIESDTHHFIDYPIFKNPILVWLFRKKEHILVFGALSFILFAFVVSQYIQVFAISDQKPLIISHRGNFSSLNIDKIRENTIESFDAAINEGADGIETDLQMLKDGTIVFYHDENLSAYGSSTNLSNITYKELQSAGITLSTLDNFFDKKHTCRQTWLFEIKNYSPAVNSTSVKTMAIADALYKKIKDTNILDCSYIGSFSLSELSLIKNKYRDIKTNLYLYETVSNNGISEISHIADAISIEESLWKQSLVRSYINSHKPVFVWTVNSVKYIDYYLDIGVRGIITDKPRYLLTELSFRNLANSHNARLIQVFGKTFFLDLSDIWQFKFKYAL